MSHRLAVAPFLVAVLGLAVAPIGARAQTVPAACRPLIDAQKKQIMTPYHSYVTAGPAKQGGKATSIETISTGGAIYTSYNGKWRRIPMTPTDAVNQLQENLANAKNLSCQRVGEESAGGGPTVVYTLHSETEGAKNDERFWVVKDTGLVLRMDDDLDTGQGTGKRHTSIRYEYTNVRAPDVGR